MKSALVACVLALLLGPAMLGARESIQTDSGIAPALPKPNCYISMIPNGTPVSYVPESDANANSTFWLNYVTKTYVNSKVKFLVKFHKGSPLAKHIQKFENVISDRQSTPFAYPPSYLAPIMGPALLKVTADTDRCSYAFEAGGHNFEAFSTLAIPDSFEIDLLNNVQVMGTIRKVAVTLSLVHTMVSDLHITLIAPDGSYAVLAEHRGGSGANFGNSAYLRTVFDDEASRSISEGTAPFIELHRPETPLSVFNGKDAAVMSGTWRLRIADEVGGNAGHVRGWSIIVLD